MQVSGQQKRHSYALLFQTLLRGTMTTVTYRGPAGGVRRIAQLLKDEGLQVDYEPPMETRGIGSDVVVVVIVVGEKILDKTVDMGVDGLVRKAVETFKRKFPVAAEIDVEDDLDI